MTSELETENKKTATDTLSGAEAVIRTLLEEGVDTIFGYPGGAIMPVYDALYSYADRMNHILVRHEQGAVHAAQGYARASGKVGVCLATSGPGATNLITGIADAKCDSTPVVCITGQVSSLLLGTDAFQETDVIGISMPVTKWNIQVTRAEEIPAALSKAFFIARTGRPGPVLVDITKDAQFGKMKWDFSPCKKVRTYFPFPKADREKIKEAATLLNAAKKPFLLAGQGILLANASEELKLLAEKTGMPVASTLLGLSAMPTHHPLNVGFLGMHGNYAPNLKTNECDVLLAVGMRFDDRVTGDVSKYAKQAKIIHIDIDPSELNKIVKADVAIHADAKEALQLLISLCESKQHTRWLNEFKSCKEKEFERVIRYEFYPEENEKLKMGEVIHQLNRLKHPDTILVTDVGQHQMAASRYFNFRSPNSNITSGGLGTMGFALPAAIGAKMGSPKREVVAVIGDGGFQMTLQELGTIAQSGIALKIIVLNNNFLGMVRQWQDLFFAKRYSFVEMKNPDFVKIANGYGINSSKVEKREELAGALTEMLESPSSYLLEIIVEKEENIFPMIPSGASVSDIRLE